jgi:hypothetical protein
MNAQTCIAALLCLASATATAEDPAAEEMQRRLNEEVMASHFNAGDIKKAEAYAEDALKKGIPPVTAAPSYWQPGWTCDYLGSYRYYNYYDYRNCVYYHHYYGRYW